MNPSLVIPIYDHGDTIAGVVESLVKYDLPCLIVDDGSGEATRRQLNHLEERFPWVEVVHHARNRGRGAALRTAYESAAARGRTHVIQLDADGQHDAADVPLFLEAAVAQPDALVLGTPIFDESVPWHRLHGRKLSRGIVWLETLSKVVSDPLCGFRCIPLAPTLAVLARARTGDRMDFDPELVIRLVRAGLPVVNIPTKVQYPERGISHFRMVEDNLRIAWAYIRLAFNLPKRRGGSDSEGSGQAEWEASGQTDSEGSGQAEWDAKERGSRVALRFLVWGIRALGHRQLRVLLAPIAVYYCLFAATARRASQGYLAKIAAVQESAKPPRLRDTYRHLYSFAEVILDRLSLWSGSVDEFNVEIYGQEETERFIGSKRGAFLVGAHIGSFDVLRVIAREAGIPVNVVIYSANAELINDAFEALDPSCNLRVINFDPASVTAGFEVRSCLARGEYVAVAGDRMRPGVKSRVAYANFLGERAAFPRAPFLMPMVLQVPVILTFGIRTGPRAYDIYLEPLADGQPVPSRSRDAVTQERVERYAARLEHYCKQAPMQWFNFYDFWAEVEDVGR